MATDRMMSDFDIGKIADSGQCFRMRRLGDVKGETEVRYEILARDRRVIITQTPGDLVSPHSDEEAVRIVSDGALYTFDCDNEEYESFWKPYFDIDTDTDYEAIRSMVDPNDLYLTEAVNTGYGIRILRQDLWEMIVSFLISQQNNIPRIRRCITNICEKYGKEGAFPTPESLASLDEDALMACNLGYRSKYVVRAARSVAQGTLDPDAISHMEYAEAREALLGLYGVGVKVADCICLFSLHHLESFPVDTHIKQVIDREYGGSFPFERYGKYAGVIQQYIFYYELFG